MQKTEVLYEFTVGPWYVVENDMVCWLISIEDWDAMVASLGPAPYGALCEPIEHRAVRSDETGPSSLAERMDAERRNLERLGRKVAFWLGTTIIVAVSCAAGWWIGWR